MGGLLKTEDFIDGNDLLKKTHVSDEQDWKLSSRLIPYLDFSKSSAKVPVLVSKLSEPITDWKSWYSWRQLPSGAVNGYTSECIPDACAMPTSHQPIRHDKRISMTVHVVGAEVELNYIPLYVTRPAFAAL